eukprot:tig00021583_g22655.t1
MDSTTTMNPHADLATTMTAAGAPRLVKKPVKKPIKSDFCTRMDLLPVDLSEAILHYLGREDRLKMLTVSQQSRSFALGTSGVSSGWFDALAVDDALALLVGGPGAPRGARLRLIAGRGHGAEIPIPSRLGGLDATFALPTEPGSEGRWVCILFPPAAAAGAEDLSPRGAIIRYGPGGFGDALQIPAGFPIHDFARGSVSIAGDGTIVLGGERGWLVWSADGGVSAVDVGAAVAGVVACRPSPDASRVAICSVVGDGGSAGGRVLVRFVGSGESAEGAAAAPAADAGPLRSTAARTRLSHELAEVDGSGDPSALGDWSDVPLRECDASLTWNARGNAVLVRIKVARSGMEAGDVEMGDAGGDVDVDRMEDDCSVDEPAAREEAFVEFIASVRLSGGAARQGWWIVCGAEPAEAFAVGLGENWLLHAARDVGGIRSASMYVYYLAGGASGRPTMVELHMPCEGKSWRCVTPVGDWNFIYQAAGQFELNGTSVDRPFLVSVTPYARDLEYFELPEASGLLEARSIRPLGAVGLHGVAALAVGTDQDAPAPFNVVRYIRWSGIGRLAGQGGPFAASISTHLQHNTFRPTREWLDDRYYTVEGERHNNTLTLFPGEPQPTLHV